MTDIDITEYDVINTEKSLKTLTAAEVLDTSFLVKAPVVEGLLGTGVYLFVGAPKVGKSFFMTQLAYHVATGKPLFGREVYCGEVLYLALEDTFRRIQNRFGRMFGVAAEPTIHFCVEASSISEGLTEQLDSFIDSFPSTRLVIIDTLQKIRETADAAYSYASDYTIISAMKDFADRRGICVVLVHHTRKMTAQDRFDQISGTNGLLGAADGAFVMYKDSRTSDSASLEVSGRDVEDQKLILKRNKLTLAWELERAVTDLHKQPPDPLLAKVKEFTSALGGTYWKGSPAELKEKLGVDIAANHLTRRLNIASPRLYEEYDVVYVSKRRNSGTVIYLQAVEQKQKVTVSDGK